MRKEFIYKITETGDLQRVYGTTEKLLELSKQKEYCFDYSKAIQKQKEAKNFDKIIK